MLALFLAFAACIQAARFPTYGSIEADELPTSVLDWQSSDHAQKEPLDSALLGSTMYNDLAALAADPGLSKGSKHRDFPIHIATKFLVKPGEC